MILTKVIHFGKKIFNNTSEVLFPFICIFCKEKTFKNIELCHYCRLHLPWIEARCYRCALRLELDQDDEFICEKCRFNPPPFDRLHAVFSYEPPITKLITGLKFYGQFSNGRLLGELFMEQFENKWYADKMLPDAIIPMPLHDKRLRKRGFNQAVELLEPLRKKYDIPILRDVCIRRKITKAQSGLNSMQRRQNVKDAFLVTDAARLKGIETVAVMDDVVTTGSTINALCTVLKEAGVSQIDVWCICRA